jgi:hypothetical protein
LIPLLSNFYLQAGSGYVDLIEWFVASAALVIVVSLVYVYILGRAPPPEGLTQAKLEKQGEQMETFDVSPILSEARTAASSANYRKAVELAVRAAGIALSKVVSSKGSDPSDMNISDMAYIVQTKSPGTPDMTQPAYQLNMLHLKAEKSEPISQQEADWAINTATWFSQLLSSSQY